MGYHIRYDRENTLGNPRKNKVRIFMLSASFVLGGLIGCIWPEIPGAVREILFPGDPAVTAAALEEFTCDLRSGMKLGECLHIFCRQILEGAGFGTFR